MSTRSVLASLHRIPACALVLWASMAVAQQPPIYQTPGDVPLCLAPAGSPASQDQLWVGYGSGRVIRLSFAEDRPRIAWEAKVNGGVLTLVDVSRLGQAGRDLVAGTATGDVICLRSDAAEPIWRFRSTCEVSCLAQLPDANGDGTAEIVAGGADHRVHLLNGRTGEEIWGHFFESKEGDTYVTKLLVGPDQDRDGTPDIAVWLWSGELAVLSGRSGNPIWRQKVGAGFTDALTTVQDLNGDGLGDYLAGGNNGMVRACSGRDGAVLWVGRLDRPIRDVVVTAGPSKDAIVYTCTAGGEVARFDLRLQNTPAKPQWTANLGDACRGVIATDDVDRDGVQDVASYAENGVVAVLSGKTGHVLRRGQVGDTVRAICPVALGRQPHLAVASLDATVRLLPLSAQDLAASESQAPAIRPATPHQAAPRNDRQQAGDSNAPRVLILLYHDVLPEAFYHYATSVESFRAQMDMLVQEKYTCVSLARLYRLRDLSGSRVQARGGAKPQNSL